MGGGGIEGWGGWSNNNSFLIVNTYIYGNSWVGYCFLRISYIDCLNQKHK